jgi:acetolactate synthase I/II/III large subunit
MAWFMPLAGRPAGDALLSVGRIAAATGAVVFCENAFARLDRGIGRPVLRRLPYFPQDAVAALAPFHVLLLADARRPVANFGYEGGPSSLVGLSEEAVWELDAGEVDVASALKALCTEVGGGGVRPLVNCGGAFSSPAIRPQLPKGKRFLFARIPA